MEITFAAANAADLALQVNDLAQALSGLLPKQEHDIPNQKENASLIQTGPISEDTGEVETPLPVKAVHEPVEKKGAVKPKRRQMPRETSVEDPKKPSIPTSGDVLDELQRVNTQLGLEAARGVLSQFKCARLSELKQSDYAAFVVECEGLLKK